MLYTSLSVYKRKRKEDFTHVFLGLDTLDAVEEDVQTARHDALVLGVAGHCVRLARRCDAVREQQT